MPDIYVAPPVNQKPRQGKRSSMQKNPAKLKKKKKEKYIKDIIKETGEKRTKKTVTSFAFLPKNIKFETQESKEQIILLLRKHRVTNFSWIITAILMAVIPSALRFVPILDFLPWRFQFITVAMWYLMTAAFVFEKFLSWYFNVYIVTDERVVDVDFVSLTYKEVTETKIDKIQDVTLRMGGVSRSMFDFGDVFIQTAGEVPRIEFMAVPKPNKVVKILNQLILQEEQEKMEGRVR